MSDPLGHPALTGAPTMRLSFGRSATAPRAARHACAAHLHAFPPWVVQDVLLVVSELVDNVVRHTPSGAGAVQLLVQPGTIWVGVTDADPTPVDVAPPEPPGRSAPPGLFLVHALATHVGVVADAGGKTVWVALPA